MSHVNHKIQTGPHTINLISNNASETWRTWCVKHILVLWNQVNQASPIRVTQATLHTWNRRTNLFHWGDQRCPTSGANVTLGGDSGGALQLNQMHEHCNTIARCPTFLFWRGSKPPCCLFIEWFQALCTWDWKKAKTRVVWRTHLMKPPLAL